MEQKLETFLALCQTMHYGRAAELLNLSQPAVSKHIKALETEYGVQLFTYTARRLHKTRAGELLEEEMTAYCASPLALIERGLPGAFKELC